MELLAAVCVVLLLVVGAAVCCVAVGIWHCSGYAQAGTPQVNLRVTLEKTPQDGWSLLNLVLTNRSGSKVWAEEATVVLSELDADMQFCAAKGRETVSIQHFVDPSESLRISLIESVYCAAGKPQGVYAFRASGVVHYRLCGTLIEASIPEYNINMIRLSVSHIRRTGGFRFRARHCLRAVQTQELDERENPIVANN